MKKILFILLLAGPAMGACPKYNFPDPRLNDELENMCHQISSILKTNPVRIGTAAISNMSGVTDGSNACAGCVGAYISTMTAANVSPALDGIIGDLVSMSIPAGDWDCAVTEYALRNSSTWQYMRLGLSSTSGNSSAGLVRGDNDFEAAWASTASTIEESNLSIPAIRISISGATTYYLKTQTGYSAGTPMLRGRMSCRRVR